MYAPWFGPLPFYAVRFLECCALSPEILWVIHSDQSAPVHANNILWLKINYLEDRIKRVFDPVPANTWRHKLCDLKPFWHRIFAENTEPTEFIGWCDWDVLHKLQDLNFNFKAAKFTPGEMCSPIFIQRADSVLEWYPRRGVLRASGTTGWDELHYLKHVDAIIIQPGLTPEVDLFAPARYAVHMYRAKHCPALFNEWENTYFNGRLTNGGAYNFRDL